MAGQNNFAGDRPRMCQHCLALTKPQRKLLRQIERTNPEFSRRFLESLTQPEPKQAPQQPAKSEPAEKKPETATQAAPAAKATLLDRIGGLSKVRKIGAGAAGLTLLYQAVDNIEDWATGRDAASSAYGVITDTFTNWQAAVEPISDVLSSPLVSLGGMAGILFVWGRKAWGRLKEAWKAAGEAVKDKVVLANEKLTGRIRAVTEFVKSASKAAFAALTCYHLPGIMDAGRSIVEYESNSNTLSQVNQILNQFFSAAPGSLLPVFAYLLAVATEWLVVSSKGFLEPVNKRKKEKMLEEQRIKAEASKEDDSAKPQAPAA